MVLVTLGGRGTKPTRLGWCYQRPVLTMVLETPIVQFRNLQRSTSAINTNLIPQAINLRLSLSWLALPFAPLAPA